MTQYWHAFINPLQETAKRIISFVPPFFVATVLFILFVSLASFARKLLDKALDRIPNLPASARILVVRSAYTAFLLIGFMVALSAANVDITAVLASLGVAGFAPSLAFKDILENFFAGILLLFSRPFEVGDQVTLGAFEGTVTDLELRTTTLRIYTNELVAIPNSRVYSNPVVNHTALGSRKYSVAFDTGLDVDIETVRAEAIEAAASNPDVSKDPIPYDRIASVDGGNDTLSWRVNYWAKAAKAIESKTVSEILERIKARLYDAGVPTPMATSATIFRRDHARRDFVPALIEPAPTGTHERRPLRRASPVTILETFGAIQDSEARRKLGNSTKPGQRQADQWSRAYVSRAICRSSSVGITQTRALESAPIAAGSCPATAALRDSFTWRPRKLRPLQIRARMLAECSPMPAVKTSASAPPRAAA